MARGTPLLWREMVALTNQIAWGKVSLKSLEITSDNQAVSHRLSAFNENKTLFS
jgi:hypothetical protein